MANMMGSHSVWVRDGVVGRGFVSCSLFFSRVPNLRRYGDVSADRIIPVCENGGSITGLVDGKGVYSP